MTEKIPFEITETKENLPTLIVQFENKKVPLHSKLYPSKEADSLREQFNPGTHDVLIVLGIGLGYHLIPLQDQCSFYSQVILVDILDGIAEHIARNRLTSFLVASGNITLIQGKSPGQIEEILNKIIDIDHIKGIEVIEHPASGRVFPGYYAEIKNCVRRIIHKKVGNKATINAFGRLFLNNCIKNIANLAHCLPVLAFEQGLTGHNALIVTSGPTLDLYVDEIKKCQESFFIICVDSALPVMGAKGIIPDFIISIDPQPYIHEHFLDSWPGSAIPVFSIASPPSLVRKYCGAISMNSHPVSQVLSHISNNSIGSIDSGTGSVIGDALSFAVKLGCKRIGLVGLDFSFIDYTIYARGTAYQKRYTRIFSNRLKTPESYNLNYILHSSKAFVYAGKFSRKSFIQYKESLESFVARLTAQTEIRNINGRGIAIKHIPEASIDFLHSEKLDKKNIIAPLTSGKKHIMSAVAKQAKQMLCEDKVLCEVISASLGSNQKIERYNKIKYYLNK